MRRGVDDAITAALPTAPAIDLGDLVMGEPIGSGESRRVFEFPANQDWVIKFEDDPLEFQNQLEWSFWDRWQNTPAVAQWLAPCIRISRYGCWLIQRRTEPVIQGLGDELPNHVPAWLTNQSASSFGILNGRLVIHDYAHTEIDTDKVAVAPWA